ncbi:hypothetical protein LIER_41798 [Lithospermum erythrorhizon]|uniref:Uncharacterized protein n=1 Tax=Lithospermum erythrorhizon TaxID=34254 RepID=A0AAV3RFR2_LITER
MGDFNDILRSSEKEGGNTRTEASLMVFQDFFRAGGLLDLGFNGDSLTWCNRRDKEACIKARLDRVGCNAHWYLNYPRAVVYYLEMIGTDHRPILLDTEVSTSTVKRLFVFDKRWVSKEGCEEVVRRAWNIQVTGSRWYRVCEKIKNVCMALIKWCQEKNFNSRVLIDDL